MREAIDSILYQDFTNFELIVIDDASRDRSLDILYSYNDPRLVILRNDENSGIVYSLNKGLKIAQGKYIARMDADDISMPDRFEKQYQFLDSNPNIGVVGSWGEYIDELGKNISFVKHPQKDNEIRTLLLVKNCIFHPSVMIRRELLVDIGYKDGYKHAEDYWLWTELLANTKFENIPEYLIKYRIRGNNISILANNLASQRFSVLTKIYKQQYENASVNLTDSEFYSYSIYVSMIQKLDRESCKKMIEIFGEIITSLPVSYNKKMLMNYFYFTWAWHTRFKIWNFNTIIFNFRGMISYLKFKTNKDNF